MRPRPPRSIYLAVLSILSLPGGLALAQAPQPYPAGSVAAPAPRFSLALERFAGLALGTVSAEGGGDDLTVTTVTLGGPVASPLALPRLALDFHTGGGLTLGAGLSFFSASMEVDDAETGFSGFLIEPRIGYRFAASARFDLIPRLSLAFARGSAEAKSNGDTDEVSGTMTIISGGLTTAYRLTESFNLLTGLSYDRVVAASGEPAGQSSEECDCSAGSLNLWIGLGGYFF